MPTNLNLQNAYVTVPEMMTDSYLIEIMHSGSDKIIRPTTEALINMVIPIMQREMRIVRDSHPEVNFSKVQEYISASDKSMNDLGYAILEPFTKYTVPLLKAIRVNDRWGIEIMLTKYNTFNKLNITGEVL